VSALDETTITLKLDQPPPCSVLLVDDDQFVCAQFASMLQSAGYSVRTACSGAEALLEFEREPANIVISDWEMPEMDGLALCRSLRQAQSRYTYLLLLTVRGGKRDVVAGLKSGADDYIVKGAPREEILARMETGRRIVTLDSALREAHRHHRREAMTDALTGARNRRYFDKYLPREIDRCRRYGHALALISCDLDHFKQVNDSYGHDAGDEVLQEFVARAGQCLRATDWLARTGGEEFAIVLPETDMAGAQLVAERIRVVTASASVHATNAHLDMTVSVGCTAVELPEELAHCAAADLVAAADRCLYVSKQRGRNRVTCNRAPLARVRDKSAGEAVLVPRLPARAAG
jgi:two-component system cell cycle response regulator